MIYILSQAIQSGKTTSLMNAVSNHMHIGGFLSPTVSDVRMFYNVADKKYIPFEKKEADASTIAVGRFHFLKGSFDTASNWAITHYHNPKIKTIIIDEIGKLELQEKGFHKLTQELLILDWDTKDCILIIRDFLLQDAIEKYNIVNYKIIQLHNIDSIISPTI
jgi:nucleoside-triphosphatase